MARKNKVTPAKIVTTYTDRVELVEGDDGIGLADLRALVDAAEDSWLSEELATVTLVPQQSALRFDGGTTVYPAKIAVTVTSSSEENL